MSADNHSLILQNILPPRSTLLEWARQVVQEDIPSFDIGAALVSSHHKQRATIYCKSHHVVLAGRPFVDAIVRDCFDCEIEWLFDEGSILNSHEHGAAQILAPTSTIFFGAVKTPIATLSGPSHKLLQLERLALNVLSRCSSIATMCAHVKKMVCDQGYENEIAATRKTTPLFRLVEKYAVIVGGCSPHRFDVSQMCMLKDNHIDLFKLQGGSDDQTLAITNCVKKARQLGGFSTMIEVECRSLQDALDAARAGANIVMLDNFTPDQIREHAPVIKREFPHVIVEVSGGLRPGNIVSYLCNSVDVYSMGCLIEGVPSVDFSINIAMDRVIPSV